jgi:hypothetical protein
MEEEEEEEKERKKFPWKDSVGFIPVYKLTLHCTCSFNFRNC